MPQPANPQQQALRKLHDYLSQSQPHIAKAIPPSLHLTPERAVKLALMAATTRGSLLPQCTPVSVLKAVTDLVAVGLEPGTGPTATAYLVPFRSKGAWEATPVIGYRGYIQLARRSGEFRDVHATVVYERDTFDLDLGSDARLVHKPYTGPDADRGAIIGAYCVARFTNGGQQIEFMRKVDIERHRDRFSKQADGGPWRDNFESMAIKTVIRRAAKHWPLSVELQDAMAMEQRVIDAGPLAAVDAEDEQDTVEQVVPGGPLDALAAAQARAKALLPGPRTADMRTTAQPAP